MATTIVNMKLNNLDSYWEGTDGYTTAVYYTNPDPVEYYFEVQHERTGARYAYKFEANVTETTYLPGYRMTKADEHWIKWRGAVYVGP